MSTMEAAIRTAHGNVARHFLLRRPIWGNHALPYPCHTALMRPTPGPPARSVGVATGAPQRNVAGQRRYAVTRRWTQWALAALDGIGGRVWPCRAVRSVPVRRILILRRERFGDLITMLPAIERARALFPGA